MLYHILKLMDKLKSLYYGGPVWPHEDLQAKWIARTIDDILDHSYEARTRVGVALYCMLPEDAQKKLYKLSFDPYSRDFDRKDLYEWLTNHVFFDHYGCVVILHDYGTILWKQEGFDIDPRFDMIYPDWGKGPGK